MEILFKKIKTAFPKATIQSEKNYVSFTFGGGLYYKLHVQKDKVRIMATNYPQKAKLGDCLKLIKQHSIEGQYVNGNEIIFEVGARNSEIFRLCIDMAYNSGELEKDSFINGVVDSCAKFHDILLPLINNFLNQPVADLYSLMGGSGQSSTSKLQTTKANTAKSVQKKVTDTSTDSLQQQLAEIITEKFPDATVKKIDKDNYLDIHLPAISEKIGTHFTFITSRNGIKLSVYSKDEALCKQFMENSSELEPATRGVRLKGNPTYETVDEAIEGALFFIGELSGVKKDPVLKKAVPKKADSNTGAQPTTKKTEKSDTQLAIEAYENEDFESVIDYFENGGKSFLIKKGSSSNYVYLEKQLDKNDTPRLVKLMEVSQSETKNPPDSIVFTKMKISKSDKLSSDKRPEESDFEAMIRTFKEGDMDKVNEFIERGVLTLQFSQDETLIESELITVCVADPVDLDLLKKIIKRGDDLNERNNDSDKYTALHYCAWVGKTEALSILLKNGALPDIVGVDGRTALHLAAANGFTDAVELLVKAGVDIDRRIPNDFNTFYSDDGSTAIREALYNQNWDVVDLLIKNGADLTNLTEPCCQTFEGTNDLFEVIRMSNEKGLYPNGNFNETKLNKLEKEIKGDSNKKEDDVDFFELLKRNLNSNTEDLTNAVLGQDDEEEEKEEIVEDEENINEDEQQDDDTLDLDDFDINEDSVIKFICDKIKREKYLTNLLYINQALDSKGYVIDKHQAYFFDSSVLISDNEMEGFLVVNMDGFYSNCVNEDEMQMIFSWSGAIDLEYQEDGDDCSIDIIADQGMLTIKKEGSHSLKILYTFYKHVWKAINDKFKDEPIIVWNDVWGMGIKEVGFAEFIDYYTFDVTSNEADVQEEEIEEEVEEEQEQEEIDETDTGADEEEDVADDFSFAEVKPYKNHFNRFLEIANKTGIHINDITVEPNNTERDELWDITRAFAARIYQMDNDKNADQNEMNFLCYYAVVSLHWCDIFNQNDKRYSHENGRFRRDTIALAICFFARIDRDFKYYDLIKESMVIPHMQFSVLMWTINTIINNNQDTLFGLFTPKQAEQANELFKQLTRKNGGADPINPNYAPENHPLRSIWWEVYRQFNNVRIPYQFIKSYISQIPPKRTFFQNLFGSNPEVKPGMNVTLLEEDRIKNVVYLEKQILHKQFPDDWILIHDISFVSIYFATTTDGAISDVEKETIYKLMSEWISEEDENKKQQMVAASFVKAKTEFDKDKSHERFEFALENIRRNFYVNYEYDEEKTHNQLIFVFNDLVAIANADNDETSAEVDLLKAILAEWEIDMSEVAGDDGEEEDTVDDSEEDTVDDSEEDEENNESSNDTDYPAFNVKMFENTNDKLRVQYLRNWQMASNVYCRRAGIRAFIPEWVEGIGICCPKFTKAQLESIEQIIRKNKIIPMLSYAPNEFFQQVKRVWWIVPFCIWREDSASWIMVDKNGLYCAHPEDNDISPMVSWENVTSVDLEFEYDGDSKVNMMTINFGEDQMLTYAEFVDENQGSYLSIVKAIYDVREKTIEESRGQQSWKEGAGGEGFKMFENPTDLLKKEIWLDNPERPNPKYFM